MLKKKYRMRKKAEFQTVFAKGKSYSSKHVVIYIFQGLPVKFGIVVSKRIGNAVQRNRAKRLLREVIRLNQDGLIVDCQMILLARRFIIGATFREVEKSVLYIWRKAGIYGGKNS
ncbi:MAG TPA: ribonuclease P protein component [Peptococcaceae bacterium]|nr:ribonuclease P protein component [Peptococcaceae bacterium]